MAQLPNYLLSNRKRLSLSQKDVAFLLGNQDGAKVSRYERFAREPIVIEYPLLFGGVAVGVDQLLRIKPVAAPAASAGEVGMLCKRHA
jgi:transcriptional regulator with XRE-family HTH domain